MPVKPSAAAEVRALIDALSSRDEVKRESAIARLAIIGARATDRLATAYGTADRDTRLAILRVAEASADPRAIPIGIDALGAGGDLAIAGAAVLRSLLEADDSTAATRALDALIAAALDPSAERAVRIAAFEALHEIPPAIRDRVAEALRTDPDINLQARASSAPRHAAADAVWQDALDGKLPEDPGTLREAVRTRAAAAPLSTLQQLVDAIRARETTAASDARREAWRQARGALHQALALRGSRIAVYDLKETLESARGPLPPSFLAAIHVVGDESCLEPIAAAWTAAAADLAWRHQLAAAFHAVVAREKISMRSAAMKRVGARFPEAARALSTPSRTTPRPTKRSRT